jgi:hypothetical protein
MHHNMFGRAIARDCIFFVEYFAVELMMEDGVCKGIAVF